MEKDTNIFMYTLRIFRIISKKSFYLYKNWIKKQTKKKIHSKFLI